MFKSLNPEEIAIVLAAIRRVSLKAGDVVIQEGDDGEDLYVVESGKLRCTKKQVRNCSWLLVLT